jgi:membrane protein involved in colicin uptake
MSTGAIVAIVIGALILIGLLVLLARRGRERRFENLRTEAQEHRDQARVRARTAEREQADADEAAARAKKSRAVAEEQAAQARRAEAEAEAKAEHAQHERGHAEQLHGRAEEIDPDAGSDDGSNGRRLFGRRRNDDDEQVESERGDQRVGSRAAGNDPGRQDSTR